MFSKVAKSFQISKVESIEKLIHKAFQISNSGRKGPVVIALPEDILVKHNATKLVSISYKKAMVNTDQILKLSLY